MIELFIGGARSGKSRLAENKVASDGREVLYIATAEALDKEMASRIQHHKQSRPDSWATIESPLNIVDAIKANGAGKIILLDCLTLWVSNVLCGELDFNVYKTELIKFLESDWLSDHDASLVIVSNEVGQGVIPVGELSRRFVDESGWLHQDIAKIADKVTFVVAGLEQVLKG